MKPYPLNITFTINIFLMQGTENGNYRIVVNNNNLQLEVIINDT